MSVKNILYRVVKSVGRIALLLMILVGVPALGYWLWSPGSDFADSMLDRGENAIWLGHGWLGDDTWFIRNRRDRDAFRDEAKIRHLLTSLRDNHIRFVYPHLCPARPDGAIAAADPAQTERFLAVAGELDIVVIPWIGGVYGESARPADPLWRQKFVASVAALIAAHPELGGVQINIEPLPSGDEDFLRLLEELRPVLAGRILGIAAYPPPTRWHPFPDVHWELPYVTEVARRSDQMAVMMYDTAIRFDKFYIRLMRQWTEELNSAVAGTECKLLLGIPAYDDAGVGYHHPDVENPSNALRGIQSAAPGPNYTGIAIYSEWEMTPEKWRTWETFLIAVGPGPR